MCFELVPTVCGATTRSWTPPRSSGGTSARSSPAGPLSPCGLSCPSTSMLSLIVNRDPDPRRGPGPGFNLVPMRTPTPSPHCESGPGKTVSSATQLSVAVCIRSSSAVACSSEMSPSMSGGTLIPMSCFTSRTGSSTSLSLSIVLAHVPPVSRSSYLRILFTCPPVGQIPIMLVLITIRNLRSSVIIRIVLTSSKNQILNDILGFNSIWSS